MINTHLPNIEINLYGQNNLFVERQAQFEFNLLGAKGKIISPHLSITQSDYSKDGAIELINFMKAQALATSENWQEVSTAKTIYIRYFNWNNIILFNSEETLSTEEIESLGEQKIFSSNDCTDAGLVDLVNELLNWMQ